MSSIASSVDPDKNAALLVAAAAGDRHKVLSLLRSGADINARDSSSRTVIKLALDNDHRALAEELVGLYPDLIVTDPRLPKGAAWLREQFKLISDNVKDPLSKPNPDLLERFIKWDLGPVENRNVSDTYWEHILLRYVGDIPKDIERNYSKDLKLSLVGTFDRILKGHDGIAESASLLNSKLPTTQYDITETVIKKTGKSGGWVTERWGYHDLNNNLQVIDGIDTFLIENCKITVKMINYNVHSPADSREVYEQKIGLRDTES